MRRAARYFAISLTFAATTAIGFADDQQKVEKHVRMMTAMSRDDTARCIVSRTFSDVFKVDRLQLVAERKALQLNYGALFLAHELVLNGASMEQVAARLREHKTMMEIVRASSADWKRIASDAKKMNSRIDDNIYKHFQHAEPDIARDKQDHYNPAADLVRADAESTPDEILKAQSEYIFWRNLAAPKTAGGTDTTTPATRSYEQARDDIAVTHGTTSPGSPPH